MARPATGDMHKPFTAHSGGQGQLRVGQRRTLCSEPNTSAPYRVPGGAVAGAQLDKARWPTLSSW
jgi:hypothetical protein